jgi:SAM-dependent methyltransferase
MINPFTIEEVRAFWDGVAGEYESTNEKVGYVHTQRFEQAMVFGNIQSGMKILNIWSRTGSLIPFLRKIDGLEITNREVSPKMMEVAINRYPQEQFSLTNLEDFSEFQDRSFDRVISLETLEHTPKPEIFMKELARILKPDGQLIMSLPPKGAEIPEFIYKLFFHDHGEGPHNFLWPSEVKALLRGAGLSLVHHQAFIIFPLGNDRLTKAVSHALTKFLGPTPLGNFGVRHFYVAKKPISSSQI